MNDVKIGDRVRATMDGKTWYVGTLVELSDIFVEYGVFRDDINELRFFITAEPLQEDER